MKLSGTQTWQMITIFIKTKKAYIPYSSETQVNTKIKPLSHQKSICNEFSFEAITLILFHSREYIW